MASLAALPELHSSPTERRLQAEWALLADLIALNPGRLRNAAADDMVFSVTLEHTPAPALDSRTTLEHHLLRLVYPRFFPVVPLELYLATPVFHPNVHPETGFVCLWDRHRTANTIEHALHKASAVLGWRLFNLDPRHTMQPDAAAVAPAERDALARQLHAPPLRGVRFPAGFEPTPGFRRRLS